MKVEVPEFGADDLKAKSATLRLDWKVDKEGEPYMVVTASASCDLPGGGTVKSERKSQYDTHDSPACDAIRAFKKVADLVGLKVNVEVDLSCEQKPLLGELKGKDGEET